MKTILLLLLLLFNNIYSSYVKKIIIEGNQKTKTSIILENISHPINAPFNLYTAEEDKKKLYEFRVKKGKYSLYSMNIENDQFNKVAINFFVFVQFKQNFFIFF